MGGKEALGGQGGCVKMSKGRRKMVRVAPPASGGLWSNGNDEDPLEGQSPQVLRGNHTAIELSGLATHPDDGLKDVGERDACNKRPRVYMHSVAGLAETRVDKPF